MPTHLYIHHHHHHHATFGVRRLQQPNSTSSYVELPPKKTPGWILISLIATLLARLSAFSFLSPSSLPALCIFIYMSLCKR